jgi:di/tricarboxylate transporter
MFYIGIIFIITSLWIAYEIWRAPLMEETEDGKLITKRPTKKLSDLWRKRS